MSVWLCRSCYISHVVSRLSCSNRFLLSPSFLHSASRFSLSTHCLLSLSLSLSLSPSLSLSLSLLSLLSRFLHALPDPAEDLSGDGKVLLLFINLSVVLSSWFSLYQHTAASWEKGSVCVGVWVNVYMCIPTSLKMALCVYVLYCVHILQSE